MKSKCIILYPQALWITCTNYRSNTSYHTDDKKWKHQLKFYDKLKNRTAANRTLKMCKTTKLNLLFATASLKHSSGVSPSFSLLGSDSAPVAGPGLSELESSVDTAGTEIKHHTTYRKMKKKSIYLCKFWRISAWLHCFLLKLGQG